MIRISAIVCTFKRPEHLRHALGSLCTQSLPYDQYEIIVVDNAVEAETRQIVKDFDDGHINLHYIAEEKVGLSRARNTGLAAALAPYVAYMDDDARADEHWLEALACAFEQSSPPPAAVGGRVFLDWHGERPSWVPERHLTLYTYLDYGPASRDLETGEHLVGANLAFAKDELVAVGGFDATLGRQGAVLLSGEEAAILSQLRERSQRIYYEPAALVWHSVVPSRKHPAWLLRRLFWDGASQPLLDRVSGQLSRRSISLSAYKDLRSCARWSWEVLVAVLSGKRALAWESLLGLSQRVGRLRTQVRLLACNSD
jgi:glycosyltransferase involved in cell wall biosynthesis